MDGIDVMEKRAGFLGLEPSEKLHMGKVPGFKNISANEEYNFGLLLFQLIPKAFVRTSIRHLCFSRCFPF